MKKKLYYGWIMLAVTFIATGFLQFVYLFTYSLFADPVIETLGFSTAAFSVNASLSTLFSSLYSPLAGKMVDKKGVRFTAVFGSVIVMISFIIRAFANVLPLFYVGYSLCGMGGAFSGSCISSNIAARWFRKYSGLASSIAAAGMGFAQMVTTTLINRVIVAKGYSSGYLLLAGMVFIISVMLPLFVYKDDPKDMGLYPDGADGPIEKEKETGDELPGLTSKEAFRNLGFWAAILAFMLYNFANMGTLATYYPAMASIGINAKLLTKAYSFYGFAYVVALVIFGMFLDKFSTKLIVSLGFLSMGVSSLMFTGFHADTSSAMVYLYIVVLAFGCSCYIPGITKTVMDMCGIKNFGFLYGIAMLGSNVGSVLGPIIISALYDVKGNYVISFMITAIFAFAAIPVFAFAKFSKEMDKNN